MPTAVLLVWIVLQVVLVVLGFVVLWRRYRLLGILFGLLFAALICPIYAINDYVSRRYSSAPDSTRLAITVTTVVLYFGIPIVWMLWGS